jgi:hypothetical protein
VLVLSIVNYSGLSLMSANIMKINSLRPVEYITVKRLAVPEGEPPSCDVYLQGVPVGRSVGGAVLEAAFAVGPFYLLMMGDEEGEVRGLTMHLLAREDFEHRESVGLVWPGQAGRLRDLQVVGERALCFRFFEDVVVLEVAGKAGWRVPFVPDFIGVFRPFGVRRWMRLRRIGGFDGDIVNC